jgi:hypothetical protein
MNLRLQPVQVATGSEDQESHLVFHEGFLVAILVRLSDLHETDAGKWFLEAGFGLVDDPCPPVFSNIDAAQDWICVKLGSEAL